MTKHPRTPKINLAEELADKLVSENLLDKPLSAETIRREYLNDYPNF